MPQTLSIAVCLCDDVTLSDFITPVELLSSVNFADSPRFAAQMGDVPYRVKIDYLAPTLAPLTGFHPTGPTLNPTLTYGAAMQSGTQFDILWVPAGLLPDPVTGEDRSPKEKIEFIKHQAPGAKYIASVCLGSFHLATAGVLDGRRATTNKYSFNIITAATSKQVKWIAKARWVVDGNIWTSSGVTAGSDMALAFLEHLVGPKVARLIRGINEIPDRESDDDPFAAIHGLI